MSLPADCKFTPDHEWVRNDGGICTVGITDHAQASLGDVVFVDLPEVGKTLSRGDSFGSVESVKAVSDLFAPIGGEVVEINEALADKPELVNQEPYGAAWMIKLKASDTSELNQLLDAQAYTKLLASS